MSARCSPSALRLGREQRVQLLDERGIEREEDAVELREEGLVLLGGALRRGENAQQLLLLVGLYLAYHHLALTLQLLYIQIAQTDVRFRHILALGVGLLKLVVRFRKSIVRFRKIVVRFRKIVVRFRKSIIRPRKIVVRFHESIIRPRKIVVRFRKSIVRSRKIVV